MTTTQAALLEALNRADRAFLAADIVSLGEALNGIRAALSAAEAAQPEPVAWRALSDHMPAPEVFVLTWDGQRVGIDWWGSLRYRRGDATTHWCPFPKPPGAGEQSMYGMHSLAEFQPAPPQPAPIERMQDALRSIREHCAAQPSALAAAIVATCDNALSAQPAPSAAQAGAPTIEAAHDMGAKGGPTVDAERLAFEAWMRGHCWALCATWTGTQYRSDAEQGGDVDPRAMRTRQLWAAWRDRAALAAQAGPAQAPLTDEQIDALRGLDTANRVRFYEHDFYVLSNFSAFNLHWSGLVFPTSEHAYHWAKFEANYTSLRHELQTAPSAHEAFKLAERNKHCRRPDWDAVKVGVMLDILRAKAEQHEYVRRKLLDTGDRELVEDSWRDDFWGWGPNRDGKNMLGRLWMQVRAELRADAHNGAQAPASTRPADASISGQRVDVRPLSRMEQLLAFCDWERKHNPHPEGKPHIAEWAAAEIERLSAALAAAPQAPAEQPASASEPSPRYRMHRSSDGRAAFFAPAEPAAQAVAHTSERHFALREAHEIAAEEAFFQARPELEGGGFRPMFNAGFVRGFDAAEKVYATPAAREAGTTAGN